MDSGLMIPADVWPLIESYYEKHERTPFFLLKLSQICRSSRYYFTSSSAWSHCNPYMVSNPADHFRETVDSSEPKQQMDLDFVWRHAATVFVLNSADKVNHRLLLKTIPHVMADGPSKYYKLGLVVATAASFWRLDLRKYAIDDLGIMLSSVKIIPSTMRRASARLRGNRELALEAARQTLPRVEIDPTDDDESHMYEHDAFRLAVQAFPKLMPQWDDDEEIVMAHLANNQATLALRSASWRLQQDEQFIRRVVACNPMAFSAVGPPVKGKIQADKKLLRDMVSRDKRILVCIPGVDRDLLIAGYSQSYDPTVTVWSQRWHMGLDEEEEHPLIPKFLAEMAFESDPSLRNDRELMKVMVTWCGAMLESASPQLQDDYDLVHIAVSNHGPALKFASPRLQRYDRIVRAACANHGAALAFAPAHRDNSSFVYELVKKDGRAYEGASSRIKNDFALLKEAMQVYPEVIRSAPESALIERDLVLLANSRGVNCDPDYYPNDREVIRCCLENRTISLEYHPKWADDDEMALVAVKACGMELLYCSPRQRRRREVVMTALWQSVLVAYHVDESMYQDPDILALAQLRSGWFQVTRSNNKNALWI